MTITLDGTAGATITGNLFYDGGSGTTGQAYGVRAWVNFNGQGTVAIQSAGNVSSITDNGTGYFTVNFTTNLPDANYAAVATTTFAATGTGGERSAAANCIRELAVGSFIILTFSVDSTTNRQDPAIAGIVVLR